MRCGSMIMNLVVSATRSGLLALVTGSVGVLAALAAGCSSDESQVNPAKVPDDASSRDAGQKHHPTSRSIPHEMR